MKKCTLRGEARIMDGLVISKKRAPPETKNRPEHVSVRPASIL